jgi:hypothetical protein
MQKLHIFVFIIYIYLQNYDGYGNMKANIHASVTSALIKP